MYPNFLCIGAPKAGTTWLHDNFSAHPNVWLLPSKSTQYFSGLSRKVRKKKLKRGYSKIIREWHPKDIAWNMYYYFWPFINDDWYYSLFRPGKDQKAGDISPSFTTLNRDQIAHVYRLMPEVKVVFLLRNPITRIWSHAMLHFISNEKRSFESIEEKEFMEFFNSNGQKERTDYLRTIDNWKSYFSDDQIFIGFFEDIAMQPEKLLQDICSFIGVPYQDTYFDKTMRRNIFKGPTHAIPDKFLSFLSNEYIGQIKQLNQMFGGHTDEWLKMAEGALT